MGEEGASRRNDEEVEGFLTIVRWGGGDIVPANFLKAHRAKILIHNILFFGVMFSYF